MAIGLSLAFPIASGLFLLTLGKEAGWDFQNYHWYNPYALFHGRFDFDIAPAHHATYYNPVLDVPLFLLARSFPAWVAGLFLGAVNGLNFVLLFWLAHTLIRWDRPIGRVILSASLALAGILGGGALGQFGATSNDTVASLGVYGALLILSAKHEDVFGGRLSKALLWAAFAGAAAGAAVGLKLTTAAYAVGLCLALLAVSGGLGRGLGLSLSFGVGVLAGMAVFAGPWMLELWRHTGNPLFPYFNGFFRSPLILPESYRDPRFIPTDPAIRLLFPFYFTFNPFQVGEYYFRDVRIALAFVFVPAALVCDFIRRRRSDDGLLEPIPSRFVLAAAAISYAVWVSLFCIYRYLIPLEMLAPLLIALSLGMLGFSGRRWVIALALLLGLSQALVYAGFQDRLSWKGDYVELQVPPIPRPKETMVLMTGYAPMAYVIPAFPKEIPFLRIQGWLVGPDAPEAGYTREMQRRVKAHRGDLYVLFAFSEQERAEWALSGYDLRLVPDSCTQVTSNIGEPLSLCRVGR